jgi:aspartate aminotransferase-like enzyme
MVEVPVGRTYHEVYQGLKDGGFIVYECKGVYSGRFFQVANMGALEEIHIDEFLGALGQVLSEARQDRAAGTGLHLV